MKPFSEYAKKIKKYNNINMLYNTLYLILAAVLYTFSGTYAYSTPEKCPTDLKIAAESGVWKTVFGDFKTLNRTYTACLASAPFKDWHWTWKAGWVRQCQFLERQVCKDLLIEASSNPAAMIRRLSYTKMGQVYEGTRDAQLLRILQNHFSRGQTAHKKDETDQMRIIFAMKQIGGKKYIDLFSKQAKLNDKQKTYLQQLSRG